MEEKALTPFGIHLERAHAGSAGPADSGASFTSCGAAAGRPLHYATAAAPPHNERLTRPTTAGPWCQRKAACVKGVHRNNKANSVWFINTRLTLQPFSNWEVRWNSLCSSDNRKNSAEAQVRGFFLDQLRAGSVVLTQKHSTSVENGRLSTALRPRGWLSQGKFTLNQQKPGRRHKQVNHCSLLLRGHFPAALNKLCIYTGFLLVFSQPWQPPLATDQAQGEATKPPAGRVSQAQTPPAASGLPFARFPTSKRPFKTMVDSRSSYSIQQNPSPLWHPDQMSWEPVWSLTSLLQAGNTTTIPNWWNWAVTGWLHMEPISLCWGQRHTQAHWVPELPKQAGITHLSHLAHLPHNPEQEKLIHMVLEWKWSLILPDCPPKTQILCNNY